jgi:hypothetical protein
MTHALSELSENDSSKADHELIGYDSSKLLVVKT